jgi:hypothetical protein
MTLTNHASDGLYPELISLLRVATEHGPLQRNELIRICTVGEGTRVRGALNTWIQLGLFSVSEQDERVSVDPRFARKRKEKLDDLTDRLPTLCRHLIFDVRHALPLWPASGERTDVGIGPTADFVRELAWTLAQDIYTFPLDSTEEQAVILESQQQTLGKFIFMNRSRWSGLRFWARYTGFVAGDTGRIDPTTAIRSELPEIFQGATVMPASIFLRELSSRLPVLDSGRYRVEVENALNPAYWRRPPEGHLSTSLSLALRRLQLDQTIALTSPADAGESFTLSGRGFRTWHRFSQIEFQSSPS